MNGPELNNVFGEPPTHKNTSTPQDVGGPAPKFKFNMAVSVGKHNTVFVAVTEKFV